MATIQEEILNDFFRQLAELSEFDDERVRALRALLEVGKKPKAAALVEALSSDSKDEIP